MLVQRRRRPAGRRPLPTSRGETGVADQCAAVDKRLTAKLTYSGHLVVRRERESAGPGGRGAVTVTTRDDR